jgi:hypothetical protein
MATETETDRPTTPKLFRLPTPLAVELAAEAARTKRPQIRIMEMALGGFLGLSPSEREALFLRETGRVSTDQGEAA